MSLFEKRVDAAAEEYDRHFSALFDVEMHRSAMRAALRAADAVVTERDAAVAATGRFECDRNCVGMNEPIEDCSAHGRTPRDLWDQIEKVAAERDAEVAAKAWDHGYTQGFYDREKLSGDSRDASEGATENPYRKAVQS